MISDMENPDEFAVLSAIWILASNDERSLVTYRGIQHRLNLPDSYDVRGLVHMHGELFRLGMPPSQLNKWKDDMRAGKSLPSWIRSASDRARCIDELKSDDGFRSQFRSDAGAVRSDVAVIDWGLSHIERLRKAKSESREATWKSWQIWLVLAASVLGSIATLLAALLKK